MKKLTAVLLAVVELTNYHLVKGLLTRTACQPTSSNATFTTKNNQSSFMSLLTIKRFLKVGFQIKMGPFSKFTRKSKSSLFIEKRQLTTLHAGMRVSEQGTWSCVQRTWSWEHSWYLL